MADPRYGYGKDKDGPGVSYSFRTGKVHLSIDRSFSIDKAEEYISDLTEAVQKIKGAFNENENRNSPNDDGF